MNEFVCAYCCLQLTVLKNSQSILQQGKSDTVASQYHVPTLFLLSLYSPFVHPTLCLSSPLSFPSPHSPSLLLLSLHSPSLLLLSPHSPSLLLLSPHSFPFFSPFATFLLSPAHCLSTKRDELLHWRTASLNSQRQWATMTGKEMVTSRQFCKSCSTLSSCPQMQYTLAVFAYFYCRKLKERIAQLDLENTALTRAHVERYIHTYVADRMYMCTDAIL